MRETKKMKNELNLFGEMLHAIRKREGITRAQMGRKIGEYDSNISYMEYGKRAIKPAVVEKIIKEYKITGWEKKYLQLYSKISRFNDILFPLDKHGMLTLDYYLLVEKGMSAKQEEVLHEMIVEFLSYGD